MSYSKVSAKVMRTFHNRVKGALLRQSTHLCSGKSSVLHLLDVGVGRGGDMFKWDKCQISNVVGYDPEESSIEEANKRYIQSCLRDNRDYKFVCCPLISDLHQPSNSMDIVSCQFTIHYFFTSEKVLMEFLTNVHDLLKPGGIFVGTFMDGDTVMKYTRDGTEDFSNSAMLIYFPIPFAKDDFSIPIKVHLTGTLYFGENTVSNEYVVQQSTLKRACELIGLDLVEFKTFEQHHNEYNNDFKMNVDCTQCSFTYSSFIFKKSVR